MRRLRLENGKHLAERPDGGWTLFPDERIVDVRIVDGVATYDGGNSRGDAPETSRVVEGAPRKAAAGRSPGKPDARAGRPGRSEDAKRWETLNEFEDLVARHLTTAEQSVWIFLFRHCRAGKASASTRGIAQGKGMSRNTITPALRWLKDRGLVWEIAKSTHRGAASVYGMHSRPGSLAAACEAANRPRLSRRERTPPRRRKPR